MENWTIKQLKEAMIKDLQACHSDLERSMVKAVCGKEIREKAKEWAKTRKLTPSEIAIASEFGYRL
jgi:ethanolamine ammonia-lyase small subunit